MSETAAERALLASLDAAGAGMPGLDLAWLAALRREAAAQFREQGLPTTRLEGWRFTDLRPLSALELVAPPAPASMPGEDALHHALDLLRDAPRLVFAGGRLCPGLSRASGLGPGVALRSLAEVIETEPERLEGRLGRCVDTKARALTALNTACFSDGAFVEIAPGTRVETPLHLVFAEVASERPVAAQPRNLIVAGPGSRAVIVEHYVGAEPGGGLTNAVSEVIAEPGAELDHVLLQEQPEGSFHLEEVAARLAAGSVFRSYSVAIGSRLSRVEVTSVLEDEGAKTELLGVYLARDRQHQDHHTTIDHAAPHTTSRELYKGILADRGRGVFHGRVHVRPDSQKINASQTNRTLLLSDGARINTKPQLEIYADDVLCSHGATVGQLDPMQLFYLRTRGIRLEEARSMLTAAFAGEVIAELPVESVRAHLECLVLGWMERGRNP